jgi:hypothetical protein
VFPVARFGDVYTCGAVVLAPLSVTATADGPGGISSVALAPSLCSHGNINAGAGITMTCDGLPVILQPIHLHTSCFLVFPPHPPAPLLTASFTCQAI